MGKREVFLKEESVQVKLSGMTGFLAVKGSLSIPYENIYSVSTEIPAVVQNSFKWAGVQLGERREGTFKSNNNYVFLSYSNPESVIVLELEGFSVKGMLFSNIYDYVVIEVADPEEMREQIERKLKKNS